MADNNFIVDMDNITQYNYCFVWIYIWVVKLPQPERKYILIDIHIVEIVSNIFSEGQKYN